MLCLARTTSVNQQLLNTSTITKGEKPQKNSSGSQGSLGERWRESLIARWPSGRRWTKSSSFLERALTLAVTTTFFAKSHQFFTGETQTLWLTMEWYWIIETKTFSPHPVRYWGCKKNEIMATRIFYGRTTILTVPCISESLRISPEHWTKLKPRFLPYFLPNTPTFLRIHLSWLRHITCLLNIIQLPLFCIDSDSVFTTIVKNILAESRRKETR